MLQGAEMPVHLMAVLVIFTMELGKPSSAQLPTSIGGGHHLFYPNMSIVTAIPSHPISLHEITNDGENHLRFGWQGGGNQQFYNVNQVISTAKSLRVEWPVKRACEIPGDVVLGGLMMVHEREDTVICGPVMPQGGNYCFFFFFCYYHSGNVLKFSVILKFLSSKNNIHFKLYLVDFSFFLHRKESVLDR